jgi:hypothetical protein
MGTSRWSCCARPGPIRSRSRAAPYCRHARYDDRRERRHGQATSATSSKRSSNAVSSSLAARDRANDRADDDRTDDADDRTDDARRTRAGAERPGCGADEADHRGAHDDRDDEDDRDRQDDLEDALPAGLDLSGSLVGLVVDVRIELPERAAQPSFEAALAR